MIKSLRFLKLTRFESVESKYVLIKVLDDFNSLFWMHGIDRRRESFTLNHILGHKYLLNHDSRGVTSGVTLRQKFSSHGNSIFFENFCRNEKYTFWTFKINYHGHVTSISHACNNMVDVMHNLNMKTQKNIIFHKKTWNHGNKNHMSLSFIYMRK